MHTRANSVHAGMNAVLSSTFEDINQPRSQGLFPGLGWLDINFTQTNEILENRDVQPFSLIMYFC